MGPPVGPPPPPPGMQMAPPSLGQGMPPGAGGMSPQRPGPGGMMGPPPPPGPQARPMYPPGQGPPGPHGQPYPPPQGYPRPSYMTAPGMRPMGPPPVPSMKRPMPGGGLQASPGKALSGPGGPLAMAGGMTGGPGAGSGPPANKKKKKLADKILPQKVRDLVPESQAYMDLLAFERKLDFTITRKRMDIQEALKRPMKQKRKLRIFISNTPHPSRPDADAHGEPSVPSWELRVEGRLLEDPALSSSGASSSSGTGGSSASGRQDPARIKRKFSSFFKSLVIELDKDLYGPDNHLVEWHRTPATQETDGFQVKRPGDKNVRCTILLLLDYQPLQFKLDPPLARILGIHTQTRPVIIAALWQYIKTHRLQDTHEREMINCDKYLEQIFGTKRMKFAEIPSRLTPLLHPPDPIAINHLILVEGGSETKKTSCYDIDVEIDDPLRGQMQNFLLSTSSQAEIQTLDNKIHETVDTINQLKTNREFFLSFAGDPQNFIHKWLLSQMQDLKTMTDQVGNPEEERLSSFFYQPWTQEAVCRYFYGKVQQRRFELEQSLNIR